LLFPSLRSCTWIFRTCIFHPYTFCRFVLYFSIFAFSSTCNFSAPNNICNSAQMGPSTWWARVLCTCCTIHCYATESSASRVMTLVITSRALLTIAQRKSVLRRLNRKHRDFNPIRSPWKIAISISNSMIVTAVRKRQYKLQHTVSLNIEHFSEIFTENSKHVGLCQCSGNLHGN